MSPQEIPRSIRRIEGVGQMWSMLANVSKAMGAVKSRNVRGRGSRRGRDESQGNRTVPIRMPRYTPMQRAQTAMGCPKMCRQRESI